MPMYIYTGIFHDYITHNESYEIMQESNSCMRFSSPPYSKTSSAACASSFLTHASSFGSCRISDSFAGKAGGVVYSHETGQKTFLGSPAHRRDYSTQLTYLYTPPCSSLGRPGSLPNTISHCRRTGSLLATR